MTWSRSTSRAEMVGIASGGRGSVKTVKNYINRIYAKLGVRNWGKAITIWLGLAVRAL